MDKGKSKKSKENEHIYNLQLTERQAKLLSYACDRFSRCIQGQDWVYQELFEEAWEKRAKKATGNFMDKEFEGGWYKCREDAERFAEELKERFWRLPSNTLNGIHYDDTADILFSLHQVLRHQLWLDGDRKYHGVDSYEPMRYGSEPLAIISKIDERKEK